MLSAVKVLAVSVPAAGHLTPMLPLLRSMAEHGDEVVVATGPALADTVTASGARFHAAGAGIESWFGRLAARTRGAPGDGLPPDRIEPYFAPRLFAEIGADDMVDGVLETGRSLRPDLVVFETESFAGPLVATLLGVPGIHHTIGSLLPPEAVALCADAVSPLWRAFDRDAPRDAGLYGGVTITICPPSMEANPPPSGDVIALRPAPLPVHAAEPSARPLVYVTLGTMWSEPAIFRTVLAGLAAQPLEVLVTVGSGSDPAALDPVPANARVERFVPQAELLPRCAAVVHHAGAGTMFGALAHGLPQLALPQAADNFTNSELLRRSGAGRVLLPGEVTADSVRHAVRALLEEPGVADAAGKVADEIAAMPAADEVAAELRRRFG